MKKESKLNYLSLNKELEEQIISDKKQNKINPYKFQDEKAIRRDESHDKPSFLRPAFIRDTEKILHLPVYNRYADKTQVFSLYNNDDITRRALHVQLVSRIARNIGRILDLNLDLIEAIALGHDIGHTPFGHAGEKFLDELYYNETKRHFNHNVHGVRVLDKIFSRNITLQALDGILCHNGEFELKQYKPKFNKTFSDLDNETENCYKHGTIASNSLIPSTLEGCIVRICDIIAYLGKDRQDAKSAKIIDENTSFSNNVIGAENAVIINNLIVDIIENSYSKNYISLSKEAFSDLSIAKKENYEKIYRSNEVKQIAKEILAPMFEDVYYKLLYDLKKGDEDSLIYKHHIFYLNNALKYYKHDNYINNEKNQIVVDYIASMTDDYFIAVYKQLFPDKKCKIEYKSYFE